MATFTITISSYDNLPPNQIGDNTINIQYPDSYTFTSDDFTINTIPEYSDPEGDAALAIKILSLPTANTLNYNGTPVQINDEILLADIGLLVYTPDVSDASGGNDLFTFDVKDSGSNTYSGLIGNFNIVIIASENQPPTSVGDNELTIDYGEVLTFTRDMFTTQTTPPYSDPEGDAALNLRITSLAVDGLIKLNGVNITINQVIPFSDIDAGLLKFYPNALDTDGDVETFTFEIADAGSGEFVG